MGNSIKKLNPLDSIVFALFSFIIFGVVISVLTWAVAFVSQLELTKLDTTLLMWLVIVICITSVMLFYSLYALCWNCKFTKLALAIEYLVFDLALGFMGIMIFAFEDDIIINVRKIWVKAETSGTIKYVQDQLKCCGYDKNTSLICPENIQYCGPLLEEQIDNVRTTVGYILAGFFGLVLLGVIFAFIRACSKPRDPDESSKSFDVEENLNNYERVWF